MSENPQHQPVSFGRPSARPGTPRPGVQQRPIFGAPTQRPGGGAPRMMDIAGPRRPQAFVAPQPQAAQPKPTVHHRPAAPHAVTRTGAPSERTLLSTAQKPGPKKEASSKSTGSLPKIRIALLVLGILLTIGGLARWGTAGSINGLSTTVGTVASGKNGTQNIVFMAGSDNAKHSVPLDATAAKKSVGTTLEVAYMPDSPEVDVKQVAPIKMAQMLGITLFAIGIASLITAKVIKHVVAARRKHAVSASPIKPAHSVA